MIQETTDYSMFQKHISNRDLDKSNLFKIINSIKARNLLYLRPIIVNNNFEIIDGQHRLAAAKYLQVPIFYQVQPEAVDEDIVLLNDNMRRWTTKDYFKYHLSKRSLEYLKLEAFMEKNNLDLVSALTFINFGGTLASNFKKGAFKFPPNIAEINNVIFKISEVKNFLRNKVIGSKRFIESSSFTKVLSGFLKRESVIFDKFMQKLELNLQWMRPCTTYSDYLDIFKKIYNYKNANPIE